jgi:hypothetical protein
MATVIADSLDHDIGDFLKQSEDGREKYHLLGIKADARLLGHKHLPHQRARQTTNPLLRGCQPRDRMASERGNPRIAEGLHQGFPTGGIVDLSPNEPPI